MSASARTLHTDFSIVHSSLGDTVTLQCSYSCKISKSTREIRWYKGTKCVHQEAFNCTLSLTLRDVKVTDSGQYRCEAHGKRIKDVAVIYLHVAGFKLVPSFNRFSLSNHFPGDDVTLPCHISPRKSAVAMEIRWFKGTDCICVYQNGQVSEGKGYEGRVSLFTHELEEGNVSLMLRNVQQLDDGSYKCKVTDGKDKVESDQNALRVREFELITESHNYYARPGDQVTLPCSFSAEVSAVSMKIRWFKGTNCICLYNNGQLNEGKGYEGRVNLFTQELEEGNVSLMLRNLRESDDGEYKCEVTHQERKLENSGVNLHVTELKLITETHRTIKSSVAQPCILHSPAGDEVILPCKLSANVSAVAMEIRWFKGTNCIFVYQNGKVRVCKGYEDRMSLFTQELEDGNVSVGLKNFQESDVGEYKCVVTRIHEVTHRDHKMESSGVYLYMSEFSLVHMPEDVGKCSRFSVIRVDFGHDVTLPCYLNPKQSAVAMEIRWFIDACYGSKRKIIRICEYQNGEVKEGVGYEGRVSLFIDKLEEGNVSLMLKNFQEPFHSGQYICEVTCGNEKELFIHHLIRRLRGGGSPYIRESSDDEDEPETRTRKLSDPRDLRPIKPGRRWSNPLDFPNM